MSNNTKEKYEKMHNDLQKKIDTGKLDGLSGSDLLSICDLGKELLRCHAVKTIIKKVADYFKSFGFMVTMDFDNVNYVIAEV